MWHSYYTPFLFRIFFPFYVSKISDLFYVNRDFLNLKLYLFIKKNFELKTLVALKHMWILRAHDFIPTNDFKRTLNFDNGVVDANVDVCYFKNISFVELKITLSWIISNIKNIIFIFLFWLVYCVISWSNKRLMLEWKLSPWKSFSLLLIL